MKPIKIALLSCNHGHGKSYYDLMHNPFYELVGVSVEHGYKDKIFLEKLPGIPKYDYDEDLYAEHPDIEAVVVASANRKHIYQVREACRRRLHIMSMKVPTFDMDEYDEMIRLTEEAGVVCQVELEMRESAEVLRVKELIEAGAVGRPLSITAYNYSHNPVWWRPWQCSPEESYGRRVRLRDGDDRFRGGALADHPHVFDMIRFVTGADYATVFAEVAPNLRDIETEDLLHVIGKLDNGMTYSLDPSYANDEHRVVRMYNWQKYPRCVEVAMNVVGTEGVIVADVYGRVFYHNGGATGEYSAIRVGRPGIWNKRMDEFYHCVRDGQKPVVGLREHRRTIEIMNAAYESVAAGSVIRV